MTPACRTLTGLGLSSSRRQVPLVTRSSSTQHVHVNSEYHGAWAFAGTSFACAGSSRSSASPLSVSLFGSGDVFRWKMRLRSAPSLLGRPHQATHCSCPHAVRGGPPHFASRLLARRTCPRRKGDASSRTLRRLCLITGVRLRYHFVQLSASSETLSHVCLQCTLPIQATTPTAAWHHLEPRTQMPSMQRVLAAMDMMVPPPMLPAPSICRLGRLLFSRSWMHSTSKGSSQP